MSDRATILPPHPPSASPPEPIWPEPVGESESQSPPVPFDAAWSQPAAAASAPRDAERLERAMISCIMPTRGRADLVERAIAGFRAQDYPDRELIIVHDRDDDLPPGIAGDDIRILRAQENSIGGKRNQAVAAARGAIIAQWDDDDWYAPERLSLQAAAILDGSADVTALNDILFFDAARGDFWEADPALFARMFAENVAGGTLMFLKRDWERSGGYPCTSMREDSNFLAALIRDGARLHCQPGRELMVYVRHASNSWQLPFGLDLTPADCRVVPAPAGFVAARKAWAGAAGMPASANEGRPLSTAGPAALVSCIMPTANRRGFVPEAIRQFLAQDYANRELIIVDDGQDSIADLIPSDASIRYCRLQGKSTLGAKRNLAVEMARGDVVVHWDDDDWRSNRWVRSQVTTLMSEQADICGLDRILFYDREARRGWRYVYDGRQPWVAGGTLSYRRDHWQTNRFADVNVGEDNAFVWSPHTKRLVVNLQGDQFVATIHRGNTSPREIGGRRWQAVPAEQIEACMRA
jgi:glycosyltransferase involved in cell wall biosynthesis